MKLSKLLRNELKKREVKTIKAAAGLFGISTEQTRCILNQDRIPKTKILVKIAEALQLDTAEVVLTAQRQRLPKDLHGMLLPRDAVNVADLQNRRKWPLSKEQCDYLGKEMGPEEIQLIRKCRQLTQEEQGHAAAYIEYIFKKTHTQSPGSPSDAPQ